MKLLSLVTLTAAAQYGDTTGSDLTDAIFKSLMFCHEWINSVSLYLTNKWIQIWIQNGYRIILFRR